MTAGGLLYLSARAVMTGLFGGCIDGFVRSRIIPVLLNAGAVLTGLFGGYIADFVGSRIIPVLL